GCIEGNLWACGAGRRLPRVEPHTRGGVGRSPLLREAGPARRFTPRGRESISWRIRLAAVPRVTRHEIDSRPLRARSARYIRATSGTASAERILPLSPRELQPLQER